MSLSPIALLWNLGLRRVLQFVAHLPRFVKLFARLAKDSRVALGPKLLLAGILTYLIFPIDLLPDFLVGLGQVDDLLVLFLGLKLFLRLCPKAVVQEHVRAIAAAK
jgi:uncharacterized membrane protein YkvA (DUF1232 family)